MSMIARCVDRRESEWALFQNQLEELPHEEYAVEIFKKIRTPDEAIQRAELAARLKRLLPEESPQAQCLEFYERYCREAGRHFLVS